ncbi:unnamed protein product [Cochlearia groenlandica]
MIPPICTLCYKNSNDHKDHLTIQTYRCSFETGVKKETISQYVDISGIHLYTINSNTIIFISVRRGNNNRRCRNNVTRKCKVCEWELDASSSALFCSLECKLRNVLGTRLDDLMEMSKDDLISEMSQDSDDVVVVEIPQDVVEEPVVKKRHRRKGIPYRSPLF